MKSYSSCLTSIRPAQELRTGIFVVGRAVMAQAFEIDNISKTIVWCDQVLNDLSDNADDAHEKSFRSKILVFSSSTKSSHSGMLAKPSEMVHMEISIHAISRTRYPSFCRDPEFWSS